jgi:hypothetical protein
MLGIMHSDRNDAAAFVFDMMEPERPQVDRGHCHVWMAPADQGLFLALPLIVGAVMSSALCAENLIRWP